MDLIERIAASATGGDNSKKFEEVLPAYSAMGYKKFELYAEGRGASPDYSKGSAYYASFAKDHGMKYSSFHLPVIEEGSAESFENALKWAAFAEELSIPVCVFNAKEKKHYAKLILSMLEDIEKRKLNFNLVVQIHEGRALESFEDIKEILDQVKHERVMALHELGSFHALGVSAQQVIDAFWPKIGLFHLKDMIGSQSVPFSKGEVDFTSLFKEVNRIGYKGDFVVELSPVDMENTHRYIGEALTYLKKIV